MNKKDAETYNQSWFLIFYSWFVIRDSKIKAIPYPTKNNNLSKFT